MPQIKRGETMAHSIKMLIGLVLIALPCIEGGELTNGTDLPDTPLVRYTDACFEDILSAPSFVSALEKFSACLDRFCGQQNQKDEYISPCGRINADSTGPNMDQNWTIHLPLGVNETLNYTFEVFDVEYSPGCVNDFLAVYDEDSKEIGRYCGRHPPFSVYSTGNFLRLRLKTDRTIHGKGFDGFYDTFTKDRYLRIRPAHRRFEDASLGPHFFAVDNETLVAVVAGRRYHEWLIRTKVGKRLLLSWSLPPDIRNRTDIIIQRGPSEYGEIILSTLDTDLRNSSMMDSGPRNGSNATDLSFPGYFLVVDSFQVIVKVWEPMGGSGDSFSMNFTYESFPFSRNCPEEKRDNQEPTQCAKDPDNTLINIDGTDLWSNNQTITMARKVIVGDKPVKYSFESHKDFAYIVFHAEPNIQEGYQMLSVEINQIDFSSYSFDKCGYGGMVILDSDDIDSDASLFGRDPLCGTAPENRALLNHKLQSKSGSLIVIIYHEPLNAIEKNFTISFTLTAFKKDGRQYSIHPWAENNQFPTTVDKSPKYQLMYSERDENGSRGIALYINENNFDDPYIELFGFGMNMKQDDDVRIVIAATEGVDRLIITSLSLDADDPKDCHSALFLLQGESIVMPKKMNAHNVTVRYLNKQRCGFSKHFIKLRAKLDPVSKSVCNLKPESYAERTRDFIYLPLRCGAVSHCFYSAKPGGEFYEMTIGMGDDSQEGEYYELYFREPYATRSSGCEDSKEGGGGGLPVAMYNITEYCGLDQPVCHRGIASVGLSGVPYTHRTIGSYKVRVKMFADAPRHRDVSFSFNLFNYKVPPLLDNEEDRENKSCDPDWQMWKDKCYNVFPKEDSAVNQTDWIPGNHTTWNAANIHCEEMGASLVSIHSSDELDFLLYMMATSWINDVIYPDRYIIYIGINDKEMNTKYMWPDHSTTGFTDWYNYQQNRNMLEGRLKLDGSQTTCIGKDQETAAIDDRILLDIEKLQPFSHVSTRCTAMVLTDTHTTTNWIKVPCEYPFCKSSFICEKGANNSDADNVGDPSSAEEDIMAYTHVEHGARSELVLARFTCPAGWFAINLPSVGDFKCYKIISLRELAGEHLDNADVTCVGNKTMMSSGICRERARFWRSVANATCKGHQASLATINQSDLAIVEHHLNLWRRPHGPGVRIDVEEDNKRGCISLQYVPEIIAWDKTDKVSNEGWAFVDTCDGELYEINYSLFLHNLLDALCVREVSDAPQTPTCDPHVTFECSDGCILKHYRCNGVVDCIDGSDEKNCALCRPQEPDEGPNAYFQCATYDDSSPMCVPWAKFCDFVEECKDGSDEMWCTQHLCLPGEKECVKGQCIPETKWCDGLIDCLDGSDEVECSDIMVNVNPDIAFQCFSGFIIPINETFDDVVDCVGFTSEDEMVEGEYTLSQVTRTCSEGSFSCLGRYKCFQEENLCLFDLDRYGNLDHCRTGPHLKHCEHYICPAQTHYKCPNAYCIPFHRLCDGRKDCPGGDDEGEYCNNFVCKGMFRCPNERHCLPWDKVCDGIIHCNKTHDDERFCGHGEACKKCTCSGTHVDCTGKGLTSIPWASRELRALTFRRNNITLSLDTFLHYRRLGALDLAENNIKIIPTGAFDPLLNLIELDLRNNLLSVIKAKVFSKLFALRKLILFGNPIMTVDEGAFALCTNLTYLNLSHLEISNISGNAFHFDDSGVAPKLRYLNLSNNKLKTLSKESFSGLNVIQELYLYLGQNHLGQVSSDVFSTLPNTTILKTDDFKFCCIATDYVESCEPKTDPFSTCEDLMANMGLRIAIWILGILSVVGNALVIIWRFHSEKRKVVSFLVQSLGMSDFLMGVYLLIIASADVYYRDRYAIESDNWRNSGLCKFAGVISMVSSEMSVFMLVIITYERFIVVVFPFKFDRRMSMKSARVLVVVGLLTIVILSVIPVLGVPYFGTEDYIKNGVCLLFNFTAGRVAGWEYAAAIYLVANFLAFLFIAIAYFVIYWTVRSTRKQAGKAFEEEAKLVRRITFVIATDFCCWMPIIVTGMVSLLNNVPLDPNVTAWLVVFVMPLNSAINPILYTFSTIGRDNQASKTQVYHHSHVRKDGTSIERTDK